MENNTSGKGLLITLTFGLAAVVVLGLFWFFFLGPQTPVGFGWYLFSFAAGLTMIVLPCTLPLAFVIVPLSLGKGPAKGFGIALAFGLGVAATLSLYGVAAAVVGEVAIGTLGAPLEAVKNWLYFVAGTFAYLFALGEIGIINFRMPSYTGAAPAFIQKRGDYLKALLLGLFLGNVGVGCPHPATPVILTRIAASGDVFYGWLLFFVHAVGRIIPLLLLAVLAILGVNALSWLIARKEKVARATGWGMVFVASFILILGLFSHDWWVYSGQHTLLEELTQEEQFLGAVAQRIGAEAPHAHEIPTGTGLFGLPLAWGTWVLLFLWILPLWWHFSCKKKAVAALPDAERGHARQDLRSLFWNFLTLSVLLVAVFGYLLPQRFLAKAQIHMREEMGEMMMEERMGEMMGHEGEHGGALLHEEDRVKEGIAVNLNVSPPLPEVEKAVKLDFFVSVKPGNIPVPESGLETQHEKKMHVIGVRRDLNEFRHIHPGPVGDSPGFWSVQDTFRKPGEYKFWSEIKYQGEDHAFGHPIFAVGGPGPVFELQKEITTNKVVERYQVGIAYDHLHLSENHIDFIIKDLEGRAAILENYLGEKMHLSAISEDLTQFVHTHPAAHGTESEDHHGFLEIPKTFANGVGPKATDKDHIGFALPFAKPGFYKVFGQFKPADANLGQDESLTAEFWIEVAEEVPFSGTSLGSWWGLLFTSLVLIALLSWGVKKYLTIPVVSKSSESR